MREEKQKTYKKGKENIQYNILNVNQNNKS